MTLVFVHLVGFGVDWVFLCYVLLEAGGRGRDERTAPSVGMG